MSDLSNIEDKSPTTVKQDLVRLDTIFDSTNEGRNLVTQKLANTINGMEIATSDPKLLEAQMTVINAYLASLKGSEDNIARRAMSKLKQAETETTSRHSAAVTDLLSKISLNNMHIKGTGNRSPDQIGDVVEKAFEDSALSPILDSELKTDPKDFNN